MGGRGALLKKNDCVGGRECAFSPGMRPVSICTSVMAAPHVASHRFYSPVLLAGTV